MQNSARATDIFLGGKVYRKYVLLADVNIPYKLTIDRNSNILFFCVNTDEFSDQSFQSVMLNLNIGLASIIPGIRNGFASAVDQTTGNVYLGGSDGIFKYNYGTNDVIQPSIVDSVDIFDMYFNDNLYFVDTCSQNLHCLYENSKNCLVTKMKGNLIQHFVIDANGDLYYVNSSGLFMLSKGNKSPTLLDQSNINIRGAATNVFGAPFFIAKDGIYEIDKESKQLSRVLSLDNCYGLAFDKNNNIIFSEERSVNALITQCSKNCN